MSRGENLRRDLHRDKTRQEKKAFFFPTAGFCEISSKREGVLERGELTEVEREMERKKKEKRKIPRGSLNFLSCVSVFSMALSLPGLHRCFRAGGLLSPEPR